MVGSKGRGWDLRLVTCQWEDVCNVNLHAVRELFVDKAPLTMHIIE
jgi:hypothetical protein